MFRIIKQVSPAWVIGENVSGFVNMALDIVRADLEAEGYQVEVFNIPALSVGAWHKRERCWIVAHSEGERIQGLRTSRQQVTNTHGKTQLSMCQGERRKSAESNAFSGVDRATNGLPSWLDGFSYIGDPDREGISRVTERKDNRANRIKALGNAVVPQIPEIIGRAIMEAEAVI